MNSHLVSMSWSPAVVNTLGVTLFATTVVLVRRRAFSTKATAPKKSPTGFTAIKYDVTNESVATITLNRPTRYNAFSQKMYEDVTAALAKAGSDPAVKVVLLTGEGKYYSSGNDLSNFAQFMHPRTMAAKSRALLTTFVSSFIDFPKPLVCAVNGPAIGIAVTTLGLCDTVLAAKSATFNTPFKALGQAPEGCSSYIFPRIMGVETAHKVLEEGWKFDAVQGKEIGLVKAVYPTNDELQSHALAYCKQIAQQPAEERAQLRMTVKDPALCDTLHKVNEQECDVLEKSWISAECFEATGQFLYSRNHRAMAFALWLANKTRWAWDR